MKARPQSVTVVCWILIATGALAIIPFVTGGLNDPRAIELMKKSMLPIPVQYGVSVLGLLITIGSGTSMLYGKNWGRLLYVGWSIVGFVIGAITSPAKLMLIPGIIFFVVLAFFLFRPQANEYFTGSPKISWR